MIKSINGKEIRISISDLHENPESENSFFNIYFENEFDILIYTKLHIGFSKFFLQSSPEWENINFDKIVENEIDILISDDPDGTFGSHEYFIYFNSHGRNTNMKFHPFMKGGNLCKKDLE